MLLVRKLSAETVGRLVVTEVPGIVYQDQVVDIPYFKGFSC